MVRLAMIDLVSRGQNDGYPQPHDLAAFHLDPDDDAHGPGPFRRRETR